MTSGNKPLTALVPLFFADAESFWTRSDEAPGVLAALLRDMRRWDCLSDIVCVTPNAELGNLCDGIGIRHYSGKDTGETGGPMPQGTATALRVLEANGFSGELLIRDPRHLSLDRWQASEMVEAGRKGEAPSCVSVSLPEDNPCFLKQYSVIREVGFMHLFEAHLRDVKMYRTRPCEMPAPTVCAATGTYWELTTIASPVPNAVHSLEEASRRKLVVASYGTDGMASLYFPEALFEWTDGRKLIGGTVPMESRTRAALTSENAILADIRCEANPDASILVSIRQDVRFEEMTFPLSSPPVLPFAPQGAGFFFMLGSTASRDNIFDICTTYQSKPNLWSCRNGELVTKSGSKVYGRQNAPELLEVNGALSLGSLHDLLDMEQAILGNRVMGHVMDSSCAIRTELDYWSHLEKINGN